MHQQPEADRHRVAQLPLVAELLPGRLPLSADELHAPDHRCPRGHPRLSIPLVGPAAVTPYMEELRPSTMRAEHELADRRRAALLFHLPGQHDGHGDGHQIFSAPATASSRLVTCW